MWKVLKTITLFKHPRLTLLEDEIELPNKSHTKYLRFLNEGDGSDIIALSQDGKVLMQQEYNHPVGSRLWQFPGGFIDKDETHEQGALRELLEESGYKANSIETIGFYYNYRRRISEISWVHIATNLKFVGEDREVSEFDMTHEWLAPDEIDAMITRGEITAGDTLAIWMLYKAFLPKKK